MRNTRHLLSRQKWRDRCLLCSDPLPHGGKKAPPTLDKYQMFCFATDGKQSLPDSSPLSADHSNIPLFFFTPGERRLFTAPFVLFRRALQARARESGGQGRGLGGVALTEAAVCFSVPFVLIPRWDSLGVITDFRSPWSGGSSSHNKSKMKKREGAWGRAELTVL